MADDQIDFAAAGLLDGVVDEAALVARKRLLEYLIDDGVSPSELRQAVAENRLVLMPFERALGGASIYTAAEVAELAETDVKLLGELRRALGLAQPPLDQRVFTDYDVGVMRAVRLNMELGIALDDIREINRVVGAAMSQLAATVERIFLSTFLRPEDDEYELGVRFGQVAAISSPEFGYVLQHVFNMHLLAQTRIDVLGSNQTIDLLSDSREMAVCFADLVGFTRLGEHIPADELGAIAERLNEIAVALVEPPVRLVKSIGDAVMLASIETDVMLDTALRLIEVVEQEGEGFPSLSVGIDMGEVIVRGGDIYGPPANHASRICDAARPSTVLTTTSVRDRYPDHYDWTNIGRRRFKNIQEPIELFRVRSKGAREREKRAAHD